MSTPPARYRVGEVVAVAHAGRTVIGPICAVRRQVGRWRYRICFGPDWTWVGEAGILAVQGTLIGF